MDVDTCPAGAMATRVQHIIFQTDHLYTEGAGAKWRWAKIGLWLAMRMNQLLRDAGASCNASVAWLPNPAQMQNPQAIIPSMMGGLGILQASAPPPALTGRSQQWLLDSVAAGAYLRVDEEFFRPNGGSDADEREMLDTILQAGSTPLAFFMTGPKEPMHFHGRTAAWLHTAFYTHRVARAQRRAARAGLPASRAKLELPPGVPAGKYVVSVHIRSFEYDWWNLSGDYFVACIRAVFASTPLSCENSVVLVIGRTDTDAASFIKDEFECAVLISRDVFEDDGDIIEDPNAIDDYNITDDESDARRGYIFKDLELMGLSDFLITSVSEFSFMAQALTSPDTIVLCAPRRPHIHPYKDEHPPCDQTGKGNSVLTIPGSWGEKAVKLNLLKELDQEHVSTSVRHLWQRRMDAGPDGATPVLARERQGIAGFDEFAPVEAYWPALDVYKESSRPLA